jgi:hypothetical protein
MKPAKEPILLFRVQMHWNTRLERCDHDKDRNASARPPSSFVLLLW